MSQNLNQPLVGGQNCACDREGYDEWADPLDCSELKPSKAKPVWSVCPICGDQVLRKSPTQVCCGSPKCYYQLEKWRKMGAKIYGANGGWVDQLVNAWRRGEKG